MLENNDRRPSLAIREYAVYGIWRPRRNSHCQSPQRTRRRGAEPLQRSYGGALWIRDFGKLVVTVEIAAFEETSVLDSPAHALLVVQFRVKDDIRQAIVIQHGRGANACGCAGAQVVDQSQLPAFDRSRHPAGALSLIH